MEASIVDLRYKMKDVLSALDRNEKVSILYHGKVKGIIMPANDRENKKVKEHPFFGMSGDVTISVAEEMEKLRGVRCHDI